MLFCNILFFAIASAMKLGWWLLIGQSMVVVRGHLPRVGVGRRKLMRCISVRLRLQLSVLTMRCKLDWNLHASMRSVSLHLLDVAIIQGELAMRSLAR